ncbi:hypothetical protein PG991_001277 [Apiospora marii]|uniref:Uncharacterized protein n=1 Tax=Apiospora marii TaxID=335849 RepID=A0ABR1STV6_9PEZI
MSVTSFPDIPVTIAVMYGCTEETMKFVSVRLDSYKRIALHPLMLPMVFVELERKRMLDALQVETSILDQRILEIQTRLSNNNFAPEPDKSNTKKVTEEDSVASMVSVGGVAEVVEMVDRAKDSVNNETRENNDTMLRKDCKATKDWLMISKVKSGVQSLITILDAMATHSVEFSEGSEPLTSPSAGNRGIYTSNTGKFQDRLREMDTELNSEVRTCDRFLSGMSMATQMVSKRKHTVRMRALKLVANISGTGMEFLHQTRRQGEHHYRIRLPKGQQPDESHSLHGHGLPPRDVLGGKHSSIYGNPRRSPHVMLILEKKKTLFSMTFFRWIPDESPQVISPWIGLYCGSAAVLTLLTWWFSNKYIRKGDKAARIEFQQQLQKDDDSIV